MFVMLCAYHSPVLISVMVCSRLALCDADTLLRCISRQPADRVICVVAGPSARSYNLCLHVAACGAALLLTDYTLASTELSS